MNIRRITPVALSLLLAIPYPTAAQDSTRVTLSGQVRPRAESRTPVDGSWNSFTSMRVRLALDARLDGRVRLFVQAQDVRLFGEEENTLSDFRADNIDLHQGFVEVDEIPALGGTLRVGRQEMAFGEHRLVGNVNWTQQGRSFDGLRYTTVSSDGAKLDLFAMKLREEVAESQDWDSSFAGLNGTVPLGETGSVDLYGLLTTDSRDDHAGEITVGGLWRGKAGPIDFRFEGSLQTGERNGVDVSAHMFGARAGTRIHEKADFTLWYDYLSGDDDPSDGETGVFNTLFATNHAFYGLADYFLNIPVHTGGLGLKDAALKSAFELSPRTGLKLDLHNFQTAQEGSLSTRSLANEADLTLTYRYSSALTVMGGYSFVQAKGGMKELGRLSENAQWTYLMLNAAF